MQNLRLSQWCCWKFKSYEADWPWRWWQYDLLKCEEQLSEPRIRDSLNRGLGTGGRAGPGLVGLTQVCG